MSILWPELPAPFDFQLGGTVGKQDWNYSGGIRKAQSFSPDRFGGSTPATAGLSFFRNRAYDARTGRWTQEDPIGVVGGVNLYQFNGNNPVTYTDPFGLCPPADTDFGPHCPGFWTLLGEGVGAIVGAIGGGTGGALAGAVACSPSGPGAVVCAAAGGTAGATGGAIKGAAIGGIIGAGIDGILHFARAGKDQGDNAGPNRDVERIVKQLGLNRAGQRALHDEITGQDLTLEEIRAIAQELAKQAKYLKSK